MSMRSLDDPFLYSFRQASRISRLSLWTACAVVLAGIEHFLPLPLPWIRLGLANGVALLILWENDFPSALLVNLLRVIIVAALFGTWSSPALLLSLTSGVVAVAVMAAARRLGGEKIGLIGVSVCGAWFHIATQFLLVDWLFVHEKAVMTLAGPSLIAAVISGVMIGWLAAKLRQRLPRALLLTP